MFFVLAPRLVREQANVVVSSMVGTRESRDIAPISRQVIGKCESGK